MSVLCIHYGKVKICPMLGFQYYLRLQCGHAQRVLVVLQVNSLKMLHWFGPAGGAWEDQVPGTDFLSWIW